MSCVILLTHFIVFFHTIKHNYHSSSDKEIDEVIVKIEFRKSNHTDEECLICDTYLDLDIKKSFSKLVSSFSIHFFSKEIFLLENSLDSIILYLKQSRSPPNFIQYI
ncbi:protein of unknown function [Tenacibaculum jejuense]|uniref:Uncharacterized protein n=1 Tax=Tenacibaculum jejuense TaxID=584609 RepID=A0A238U707_9FLAO|nr:protein of unknown function [Tenacibaculum jejuense]